ncbi:MAG: exodeoxyribonuclease III [Anaerolineales bacterium]
MKIITWNINGLRAWLNKGAWAWITAQNPDILCLQEIKARPDQLTAEQLAQFAGYEPVWNPAERPGYSGTVTFLRRPANEARLGLDDERFDHEGRVVQTVHANFRLFNIYFPNGGSGNERVPYKLDFYARLLELCDDLHGKGENIILTGDFNTCHQEIDLANPKSNQKSTGFMPEEREWVTRFLEHGFVDIFRARYPDRVQYTWWAAWGGARARNVGWRLDYFLISPGLVDRVQDVVIHDQVLGSDHCPVELVIG